VIRLLLDENISPTLAGKLGEQGVYAVAVPHVGLAGQPDHEIWNHALEHDFAIVTINARALPLIDHIKESGGADFLVNKLIEVFAPRRWEVREIPNP